jgi:hypothetical protein
LLSSSLLEQYALTMLSLLSLMLAAFAATTLAAPYPPTNNIPLHAIYHYCSPVKEPSTLHSNAVSIASSFCEIATSKYSPESHGEVEVHQDDGLFVRTWWDSSKMQEPDFKAECEEAVKRILRGCQRAENEDRFYGGVSEFARIKGKVEVGFA